MLRGKLEARLDRLRDTERFMVIWFCWNTGVVKYELVVRLVFWWFSRGKPHAQIIKAIRDSHSIKPHVVDKMIKVTLDRLPLESTSVVLDFAEALRS